MNKVLDHRNDSEAAYAEERIKMVERQIQRRGISDKRVLEAMRTVPRHLFIDEEYRAYAYSDGPLPIGDGQTISQPYIVAFMTELLELKGHEVVLEIGTGSGYQAAILAHLAREVYTIERHQRLAQRASQVLAQLGLTNVHIHIGDGSLGLPAYAPYEGIIVTAGAPQVPPALLDQLTEGGRLVIPVGSRGGQILERWIKHAGECKHEALLPVAFVPLVGLQGWEQ